MNKNKKAIDQILKELPENVAVLIYNLFYSENFVSKRDAKNKLVKMGRNILPHLIRLLIIRDESLRREVAKLMKLIADKKSVPVFIELLEDNESGIRWIAAEGLVHIGRESIVPLLKSIFNDKEQSYYLRAGAHHVLNELFTSHEKIRHNALMRSLQNYLEIGETLSLEVFKTLQTFDEQKTAALT